MTNKNNIQAGSFTASLASVKLSGTISVSYNGTPVPRVYIYAQNTEGHNLNSVSLDSLGTTTPWSMTIPAQSGKVSFQVYGYDSSGGNQVFSKTLEPSATNSVAAQSISGIAFNIGDISVGRLKGSVSFTNMPNPAPYQIYLSASYQDDHNNWWGIANGRYFPVTVSGSAGTWTIQQDEEFLAYLGSASLDITFDVYMQISGNEGIFMVTTVEKNVTLAGLTSINLGSVSLAYITLSGTITVNQGGALVPQVYISARDAQGRFLTQTSLRSPTANTSWSISIPAQEGGKVIFYVYGYDASGQNQVFNRNLEPATTAAVSGQSISGIALNIGDVTASDAPGGGGGGGGGGDPLAEAKGKLTLSGFSEFNGKYVYSALVTASNKVLIGTNAVTLSGTAAVISMVQISGGNAEVPLYYLDASAAANGLAAYVPYEGSEEFTSVGILIVDDDDGKFTAGDSASFATSYVGSIGNNTYNTGFTPSTSSGNITINRSETKTLQEVLAGATNAKYILTITP
jgi:hypothetical protein